MRMPVICVFSILADLVKVKVKSGTLLFTNNSNAFRYVSKVTVNFSRLSWSLQFAQCSHFGDAIVVARRGRAPRGKTGRGRHSLRRPASLTATATACPTPRHPATTRLGSLLVLSTPRHPDSFRHRLVTGCVCSVPRHGAAGAGGEQSKGGSSSLTGIVPVAVVVHFPLCRVLLGRASAVTSQVTPWFWHRAASAPPDSCAPVCTLLMDRFYWMCLNFCLSFSGRCPPSPAVRRLPPVGPRFSAMPYCERA